MKSWESPLTLGNHLKFEAINPKWVDFDCGFFKYIFWKKKLLFEKCRKHLHKYAFFWTWKKKRLSGKSEEEKKKRSK